MSQGPAALTLARDARSGARTHAPACGPSLEQRTNFDEASLAGLETYNFKRLSYPDGSAEMVATRKRSGRFRAKVELIDPETGEIFEPQPVERTTSEILAAREKSFARTRTSIRRACQGMNASHMLTLTYRENMQDLKRGWTDLARFLRAVRDALGGFDYVVVAETQKRGAWHFHLAVRGRQDLALLRKHWTHGNLDVAHRPGGPAKLASYMSKYLAKSFWQRENTEGHRYRRSQGIVPRPVMLQAQAESAEDIKHIMHVLFREAGLIGFAHFEGGKGTAGHYVWGCTWLDHPQESEP